MHPVVKITKTAATISSTNLNQRLPETGKKELLLLDFLWMTERHDLCNPSALIAKDELYSYLTFKI